MLTFLLSQNKHDVVKLSTLKMTLAFILSLWLYLVDFSSAKEIIVGENAGGWSVGGIYEPLDASVGDKLVRRISSSAVVGLNALRAQC